MERKRQGDTGAPIKSNLMNVPQRKEARDTGEATSQGHLPRFPEVTSNFVPPVQEAQ